MKFYVIHLGVGLYLVFVMLWYYRLCFFVFPSVLVFCLPYCIQVSAETPEKSVRLLILLGSILCDYTGVLE